MLFYIAMSEDEFIYFITSAYSPFRNHRGKEYSFDVEEKEK